jgi:type IV pilus assembly protein PilM
MAIGPIVGLDIGTQQIKAVELKPNRGMLTVSALGIAPTPVGVMQNNIITDPRLMGQTVRQLLRESGITSRRVVGSVAGQSAVVVRIIEVPKMTDAELRETMKWEVERHVPFAPSETKIAYERLDPLVPDDANPNMEVLLAVAQQDILNNFVDTVYAAGLDPVAIDIEQLAVGRSLLDVAQGRPVVRSQFVASYEAPFEQAVETVAVVNIGAANTDILIYQQGQLAFPRSLPLAGDSLTRAIAEAMGYTLDQAERIKREYASVQLDRMAIYTGTAYYDDGSFGGQFAEDDSGLGTGRESGRISGRSSGRVSGRSGRISGRLGGDEGPLSNPFDLSLEGEPTQQDPLNLGRGSGEDALNLGRSDVEPLDRTQPMSRQSLNLGGSVEEGLAAMPTGDQFGPTDASGANFLGGPANETEIRDQVFEAVAPVLGELATELRRSFDYFRSRAQGRTVDRVLLAGGTAALSNLDQFLQRELQIPVAIADPFSDVAVMSKHYDPGYLRSIASTFAVAFGLAARELVLDANPAPKRPRRQRVVAQPDMPPPPSQ